MFWLGSPKLMLTSTFFVLRICPGRFFAQSSVFLIVSNILKTFTIEPAEGETAPFNVDMTYGVVSCVLCHPCGFDSSPTH